MATVDSQTDKMVCYCYGLRESDVRASIELHQCERLEAVMRCSGAGTGCTACHRRIQAVLDQQFADRSQDSASSQCSASSPTCVIR